MVELEEIKLNELHKAYKMHKIGFMPTFLKYHDRINPIFMSFIKFNRYFNSSKLTMFWIINNHSKVGQIWIKQDNDEITLARLFVLPKYQNHGIAQNAILIAEQMFPNYDTWWLDTIKQEKNNCHLYEKLGYIKTGEKEINKRMTIITYKKEKEKWMR